MHCKSHIWLIELGALSLPFLTHSPSLASPSHFSVLFSLSIQTTYAFHLILCAFGFARL